MKSLFNKNFRFKNCLYIFFIIFVTITSIVTLNYSQSRFSILTPIVFGYPLLIASTILLIIFILKEVINNNILKKVYSISFIFLFCISLVIIFDVVIIKAINDFKIAYLLDKRPNSKDYSLSIRLAYIVLTRYKDILSGVFTTIWLSLLGTIIGLLLGFWLCTLKKQEVTFRDNELCAFLKRIGQGFANVYVTIFRGTPMIVQAMIIYYFLPTILSSLFNINQDIINNIISVPVAGLITVSLNTAAYLAEVIRGGIESLDKGQTEAARCLGLSRKQAMRYVILPQAFKNALPSICNEFIINIKDTSVLSVISVMDLYFVISTINGKYANQDAIFICAFIYLVLTVSISMLLKKIERKMNLVEKTLPSSN